MAPELSKVGRLPDFLRSVKLKYVKLGYKNLRKTLPALIVIPILGAVVSELWRIGMQNITDILALLQFNLGHVISCSGLTALLLALYWLWRSKPIYLVDFACYTPPRAYRAPFATFLEHSRLFKYFDERSLVFQLKILERSGLSEETCLPPALHHVPPRPTMESSRKEFELVIYTALDELFSKTGIKPREIDILVVNCSIFCPTPSLSAMVVNKYKMRGDIKSFSLAGMGCSAGVIAVDLAKSLLQVHSNSYAVVVSTETITPNWYVGNERSMLLPNCLFRMGGAAVLLSNKPRERRRAKYELVRLVRTHKGSADRAYKCVYQEEDEHNNVGISLSKDLMAIAGEALKSNITTLGPLVLPVSEQLVFVASLIAKKFFKKWKKGYIPDFKKAFEHFCIHAGGRAVIEELEKNLGLGSRHVEASRMTLHRFGNTSSSSLWYEMAYIEAKGRMKKGDRVWQIAFGSGFKCNSAVWRCLRSVQTSERGPWSDCINAYPVLIPEIVKF